MNSLYPFTVTRNYIHRAFYFALFLGSFSVVTSNNTLAQSDNVAFGKAVTIDAVTFPDPEHAIVKGYVSLTPYYKSTLDPTKYTGIGYMEFTGDLYYDPVWPFKPTASVSFRNYGSNVLITATIPIQQRFEQFYYYGFRAACKSDTYGEIAYGDKAFILMPAMATPTAVAIATATPIAVATATATPTAAQAAALPAPAAS